MSTPHTNPSESFLNSSAGKVGEHHITGVMGGFTLATLSTLAQLWGKMASSSIFHCVLLSSPPGLCSAASVRSGRHAPYL